MNFQQIVQAVKEGNVVHWTNNSYRCVWFNDHLYIVYLPGYPKENCVRVTENMFGIGKEGYSESDFFVEEG